MIDTIRLSESAKRRLINLKRITGIEHWNILCRWALCLSLSESTNPPRQEQESMSSIEMTWKVFAGQNGPAILATVINEYHVCGDQVSDLSQSEYVRLHIERGISSLSTKLRKKNISSLVSLAASA